MLDFPNKICCYPSFMVFKEKTASSGYDVTSATDGSTPVALTLGRMMILGAKVDSYVFCLCYEENFEA